MSLDDLKQTARIIIKLLEMPPPEVLQSSIKRMMSNENAKDIMADLGVWKRALERVVQAYASDIRVTAERKGIQVNDNAISCRKRKGWCFTCLSNVYGRRFKGHYPYWERKMNHNGEARDWINIKQSAMRDQLRELGYTEGEIEAYEYAVELRKVVLRIHNMSMMVLKHLQLLEEKDIGAER